MPDDGTPTAAAAERPVDSAWDEWETPSRVPSSPELHLDHFDGPLDLLIDLAERGGIDLARVSLRDMVEQFVAALVRFEREVALERRADWLVLASRLVLLRSRLLFPASVETAQTAADEAEQERARLQELRFIKAAAGWLEAWPQLGRDVFARGQRERDARVASYMRLMEACLTVLRDRDEIRQDEAVYRPDFPRLFRIPGALARMRALLQDIEAAVPLEYFLPAVPDDVPDRQLFARSALSTTLVTALELCRQGAIGLEQLERVAPIQVSHREVAVG